MGEREAFEDAAALLKKYRKLCVEVGRGDSFHLARIDKARAALAAKPADHSEQDLKMVEAAPAPPAQERKPLTDEQIDALWSGENVSVPQLVNRRAISRSIERAHGIGA